MFVTIVGVLAVSIFLIISLIHFYWAFGGKWGLDSALPKASNGQKMLAPGSLATTVVALGLLSFAFLILIKLDFLEIEIPAIIFEYGLWGVSAIFALRAIGDFKYAGFFKKIKNTDFSRMDSKLYTPLCLFLAFASIIIQLS